MAGLRSKAIEAFKDREDRISESAIRSRVNYNERGQRTLNALCGSTGIITDGRIHLDGIEFEADCEGFLSVVGKCDICGLEVKAGVQDLPDIGRLMVTPGSQWNRYHECKKEDLEDPENKSGISKILLDGFRSLVRNLEIFAEETEQ